MVKHNSHNGVDYTLIESDLPGECAFAYGLDKYVLFGKPAIEIMNGSYKYGDQVQITVYAPTGSVEKLPRVSYSNNYDRMEMFMDRKEFTKMCKEFLDTV